MLRLDKLPTELLIVIFDYCSLFDLTRLSQVCKRFYNILCMDSLWNRRSDQLIVTNQNTERFRERCNSILSACSKWHISNNWRYGRYQKRKIFLTARGRKSWLQLTDDKLWFGTDNYVCYFEGAERFNIGKNMIYSEMYKNTFTAFVLTKDFIITSDSEGYLLFWMLENYKLFCKLLVDSGEICAIDATSDIILTVSENLTIKLLPAPTICASSDRYMSNVPIISITMEDRLSSVAFDPTGTKFSIGLTGIADCVTSLHIYDIQRCDEKYVMDYTWRCFSGIMDTVWEDPHTLLTCSSDAYIRKWDLRTRKCVKEWLNITKTPLYCISSDYQYTMITGTTFKSAVLLWDQRQSNHVQVYFICSSYVDDPEESPVFHLQFDSSHLYCVTDEFVTKLTFSDYPKRNVITNY